MLSYQHGYHAGNFADVHKHLILSLLIQALNTKAKPWSYLESHAGRALYELADAQANKTGEYRAGIARLWSCTDCPALMRHYLDAVRAFNPTGALLQYPGSPALVAHWRRPDDNMAVMELHPQEAARLKQFFRTDRQVGVHQRDGYEGVLSLLPPKPNRGLVLVDPAYEVKDEYQQVATQVQKMHQRWPNGCFAIWYPLLTANRHRGLIQRLVDSGIRRIYQSEFSIWPQSFERMRGSGMLLINPPWQLDQAIESAMPWLAQQLGQPGAAPPRQAWLVSE